MNRERRIIVIQPNRKASKSTASRTKLRVAAYCRVSTEEEEQQGSFEIQKEFYTAKINSTPEWQLAGIYADDGISGVHTKKRDGFNQMIQIRDETTSAFGQTIFHPGRNLRKYFTAYQSVRLQHS